LLCEPGDPEGTAEAVVALWRNGERLLRLGLAGVDEIASRSWARTAADLEASLRGAA
jgi:hypothetical protein